MLRNKLTKSAKTLLIGLIITSTVACGTNSLGVQQKPKPVKPTILVEKVSDKMCMSLHDGSKLGLYILELERGY